MPSTYLEPTISVGSAENYNVQSVPASAGQVPENAFEDVLSNVAGTGSTLAFLASDGLAFSNANNPSFGGTVVSTAINNVANTSPAFGTGGYPTGYGAYGGGAYGYGGAGLGSIAALNTPGLASTYGGGGAVGGVGGAYGTTDVKQGILDEGLQQILLMADVQSAARTLDTYSNIIKTKHDADMNTIRNIRSG